MAARTLLSCSLWWNDPLNYEFCRPCYHPQNTRKAPSVTWQFESHATIRSFAFLLTVVDLSIVLVVSLLFTLLTIIAEEFSAIKTTVIRLVQKEHFYQEYEDNVNENMPANSELCLRLFHIFMLELDCIMPRSLSIQFCYSNSHISHR